ncbi:radical SAM protein, partial [Candidatus Geothermarchaeota archaeon]
MVRKIIVKTILNKHRRDSWFLDDYSLNPYEACAFNCVFCYIRGSKYGRNMQKSLSVKVNACRLLEKEISVRMKREEYGFIIISSSTEAWQRIEEKYKLTRRMLKIIARYKFPVHVLTKSTLVLRDLDVLKEIDRNAFIPQDLRGRINHGVFMTFSLSTLDEHVSKIFEPNAPTPAERLEAMKECRKKGFLTGVAYIPVLPFISDSYEELDEMIKTAKEFGAHYVFVGALTLFGACKEIYTAVLKKHFPELLPKYRRLFRIFNQPSK